MNADKCVPALLGIQETGIWKAIPDGYFWFLWKIEMTAETWSTSESVTGKSESFVTTDTTSTLQLQEGLISKEMEFLKQQTPTEVLFQNVKQSLPFHICTAGPPRWSQNIGRSLPASLHFPVSREEPELLTSTKDLRSFQKVSPRGLTVRLGCTTPSFPVRPRSTEERSEVLIFLPTMPRARPMFPLFSSLQATRGLRLKAD